MGIKALLRLCVKLQDQLHVLEMVTEASVNGIAGVRKILCVTGQRRPPTLREVLLRY
jgi:hypothetical protein